MLSKEVQYFTGLRKPNSDMAHLTLIEIRKDFYD